MVITKRVKILEVSAEVSDEDPIPRYTWKFLGKFNLHQMIGLLFHIITTLTDQLRAGTHTSK